MEQTAKPTAIGQQPQHLGTSLINNSLLAAKTPTTSPTEWAARLDAAFEEFVARRCEERGGWVPMWTASLRAEMWSQFAYECRELLKASGVPPMDQAWDLETVADWVPSGYRKVAKRMLKMIDEPVTLAINGGYGSGKSTLAWWMVTKFCNLGRPAIYRTASEMFNELNNAPWAEKQAARERWIRPALLVIDEVQVRDSGKDWQDNELITLIDRRYRERELKSTLLMANLEPNELQDNLGGSIWRRLIETGGQPIDANWGRLKELQEKAALALKERQVKAAKA